MKNVMLSLILGIVITMSSASGESLTRAQIKNMNNNLDINVAYIEAARAVGIDPKLLRAVCFIESSHRPNIVRALDYNAPSYGICQLQLRTAQQMGFKGNAQDLLYAPTNMYFAAKYLAKWLKKTHGDWRKAVSAYNRGHLGNLAYNYVIHVSFAMKDKR